MTKLRELLDKIELLCKNLENDSECKDEPLPIKICTDMPCLATPEEVTDLIKAGYHSILRTVTVKAILGHREHGIVAMKDIPMIQIASDRKGCAMCKEGECLLWKSGLTPIMGKMHLIMGKHMTTNLLKFLIHITITQWEASSNASTIEFCRKSMEKSNSENPAN